MSTPVRLGVFLLGLVAVFAAAVGVGRAVGPVGDDPPASHAGMDGHGSEHASASAGGLPGGLATSADGLTLVLDHTTYKPGLRELAFRVEDVTGAPVTEYDVEHDKLLHVIVVRRDFSGFQHVHPELDASGTWRVPVDLAPGSWRVFADFVPAGGDKTVLGTDLSVPGAPDLTPRAPLSDVAEVDGYTVTVDGDLVAGEHSVLDLTVSKDGQPVTDLEPYLGAYSHLVALREGDLAYLHVHPSDGPAGPTVEFGTEVPSAGRYHLYLDFQHDGVVRTASFTVEAGTGDIHVEH